jgi:ribosomal protein S18 acetylase RimI-like enzyme
MFQIRPWNRTTDQSFFDHCQLESFKTTLPNAEAFSDEEIQQKYEEFDKNDPIDLSSPGHVVFIGETANGYPAGLIWVYHREAFWRYTEPLAWIYNLHVLPACRRMGLAKLLLAKAEAWAKIEGLTLIALHVLERNASASALYKSCSYTLVASHNESYFYEKRLIQSKGQ